MNLQTTFRSTTPNYKELIIWEVGWEISGNKLMWVRGSWHYLKMAIRWDIIAWILENNSSEF